MVLSDTTNMPALFAKHPSWHGQIDADPVLAEATRRRLFDRAVSDKALVNRLPLPVPRRWCDRAGRRRLYLLACCIINDVVYGNGRRSPIGGRFRRAISVNQIVFANWQRSTWFVGQERHVRSGQ